MPTTAARPRCARLPRSKIVSSPRLLAGRSPVSFAEPAVVVAPVVSARTLNTTAELSAWRSKAAIPALPNWERLKPATERCPALVALMASTTALPSAQPKTNRVPVSLSTTRLYLSWSARESLFAWACWLILSRTAVLRDAGFSSVITAQPSTMR